MKNGDIVANSGHFNVEIDIDGLTALAKNVRRGVRNLVDEFTRADGRRIFLLAEGRLVNLAAAEGHPASVMDMSFATQAMTTEWAVKNQGNLSAQDYRVPKEIEDWISQLKLETMGVAIDTLNDEQRKYLTSWQMGT